MMQSGAILSAIGTCLLRGGELLLLFAALHDIATRTVPNWVAMALLLIGVALRLLAHQFLAGAGVAALVFFCAALCWRRGWMGGADVKLFGASCALVPPGLALNLLLAISLAGGGLAAVYLALRPLVGRPRPGRPAGFLARVLRVERRRIRRLETIPYASAIAAGALFTLTTVH